jgi:carbonic anhydrase
LQVVNPGEQRRADDDRTDATVVPPLLPDGTPAPPTPVHGSAAPGPPDVIEELLERNRRTAMSHPYWIGPVPTMHVAVVACMDTRVDTYRAFGIEAGEVHLLRNAGGVVTDDVIRSLAISQHALGTRHVMVVHHTDCGLARLEEDSFRSHLAEYAGYRPTWAVQAFKDPHDSVRESMLRLRNSPFLLDTTQVRGFVFDVKSGLLEEVFADRPVHDGGHEAADSVAAGS